MLKESEMRKRTDTEKLLKVSCSAFICLLSLFINSALGEDTALVELKLEGKYIQKLVLLENKSGNKKKFDQPSESIKLPAGEYNLLELHLEGGYQCRIWSQSERYSIKVTEDKQAILKFGAPLKQNVNVKRQGSLLVLSYELLGIGEESYTGYQRSKAPQFSIYHKGKKIASGSFEFG